MDTSEEPSATSACEYPTWTRALVARSVNFLWTASLDRYLSRDCHIDDSDVSARSKLTDDYATGLGRWSGPEIPPSESHSPGRRVSPTFTRRDVY